MKINISSWAQVVEIGLARCLLFRAKMGARRSSGDDLTVYNEPGKGGCFYVDSGESVGILRVDEGNFDGAMHLKTHLVDGDFTVSMLSLPWCEYVDATDLLGILCRKLCPAAVITQGQFIGRGRNQRHALEQYITHLVKWSQANPEHSLQFI